jgi:AAA domain
MPPASDPPPEPFPVRRVDSVESKPPEAQWLVEPLWGLGAVGVLGAAPRSLKSWLAAELSLAVAAGSSALGRFPARAQGPVLFFGAEDGQADLRIRFEGIARARGLALDGLPIFLLDVPQLRLDRDQHLDRLRATVAAHKPLLLVLDPFVRLVSGIDENSATEVSAILGALRTLQRDLGCAVLLIHHMRKTPSAHLGERLRGSSDFAAWSDSACYIMQRDAELVLYAEHRNAPAPPPVAFRLELAPAPHLCVTDLEPIPPSSEQAGESLAAAVLQQLASSSASTLELRERLKIRKATLVEALGRLRDAGHIVRDADGWSLPRNDDSND